MDRNLLVESKDFFLVFILPIIFGVSFYLLELYTGGDQLHYRNFYSQISGLSYAQAMVLAPNSLGAGEPISIFVLWLGSYVGLDKSLYVAAINTLLAFFLVKICNREKVSLAIIILVLMNFYFIVLLTGAERLKIAYLFLFSAFFFRGGVRKVLVVTSCLVHFQIFLLIPSLLLYSNFYFFFRLIFQLKLRKQFAKVVVPVVSFSIVCLFFLNEILISKINAYLNLERSVSELINLILLIFIGVLSSSNYRRVVFSMSPFIAFVFFLGGDRVNMLAVTFLIGVLILENRVSKPLHFMLLVYFCVKSVPFVQSIIEKGNGFA